MHAKDSWVVISEKMTFRHAYWSVLVATLRFTGWVLRSSRHPVTVHLVFRIANVHMVSSLQAFTFQHTAFEFDHTVGEIS
jgi:hypothetical protein